MRLSAQQRQVDDAVTRYRTVDRAWSRSAVGRTMSRAEFRRLAREANAILR